MEIILFGGTFNPVHCGHVNCVKVVQQLYPNRLVGIVPAGNPPHKQECNMTPLHDRIAMLQIAFSSNHLVEILPLESELTYSYTIETVQKVADKYRPTCIYFVIGSDMFLTLHTWHSYQLLLQKIQCIVVIRQENTIQEVQEYAVQNAIEIHCIIEESIEISSTQIRQQQQEHLLPQGVLEYIREKQLYGYCNNYG